MISRNLQAKIEAKTKSAKTQRKLTEKAEELVAQGMTDESVWEVLQQQKVTRKLDEEE